MQMLQLLSESFCVVSPVCGMRFPTVTGWRDLRVLLQSCRFSVVIVVYHA